MGAVTVATSIRGWNFKPHEFAEGTGRLIRAKDGASILASTDNRLWEEQIHDFEFIDGEQWTVEQIAAMKPAIDLHRRLTINELPDTPCFPGCACLRCVGVVKPGTKVAVPNQAVVPTYYDIFYDERRPITQAILDNMESGIQRLAAERDQIRADKDIEIALLRQALAMKDARIGELKSVLASTPVAFEDPDAKPEPVSNPFREFPRDMRKMGP